MRKNYDIVVIGAGIVGLTLARELALRKAGRILVLEKENSIGRHASGRNSGVVHAGIYYASDSLKAKLCVEGARRLLAYVDENGLPVLKCGKVIVATRAETVSTLEALLARAKANQVPIRKISLEELAEIEPEARSHAWALFSPTTAVIDSKAVLARLQEELTALGVEILFARKALKIDPAPPEVLTEQGDRFGYGFLYNAAGVHADRIAHLCGVGRKYRILPFKGLYWQSSPDFAGKVRGLIYPAPDVGMPFLGVHITKTVDGKVLFGPTAIPAFGRENYSLLGGLNLVESPQIAWHLLGMLVRNPGRFRTYVREELGRYAPKSFFEEAKTLVRTLERTDMGAFYKVGIRAQLMDLEKKQLEMDFVLEPGPRSLHVLNAVSPAFTSAFAIAPALADRLNSNS